MKRARPLLCAVLATLALGGCEAPPARTSLVIAEGTDVGVLLPVVATSAMDAEIGALLYLNLNSARWEDGKLKYSTGDLALAERWEFSADSTVLTYFLRPDAVWSDGHPIDASDVEFTFELIRKPEIASVYIDSWEHLDSVVAVSGDQVAFHFRRRYPGMLFHTGLAIIPEHVFAEFAADNATLAGHPALVDPDSTLVVSGPYRVAEWRQNDRLVLEANPSALTRPATDTVIFRVIPEASTRLIELKTGAVDVTGPITMSEASELDANPDFRIETIDDRSYDFIGWNGAQFEPFVDADVRRALSIAIDRSAILDGLGISGYARPAAGPYPSIFGEVADPDLRPDPHAPNRARAVLAAQGWSDSDGDGVLDRDGSAFRFTLLTQVGNERRTSAAEIIQAQYARIGIDMRIELVEWNTLLGLVFEQRDFEAVLMGWQIGLQPDYIVGRFWPTDHLFNITGYASSALDSLIPLAQVAATADEAAPHWRAAARIIANDRPYAFLWFWDDAVALSERVRRARIDTYGLYQNLHHWTLGE